MEMYQAVPQSLHSDMQGGNAVSSYFKTDLIPHGNLRHLFLLNYFFKVNSLWGKLSVFFFSILPLLLSPLQYAICGYVRNHVILTIQGRNVYIPHL